MASRYTYRPFLRRVQNHYMNIVPGDSLLRAMAGLTASRNGSANPNFNSTNQANGPQAARPKAPARAAGQISVPRPVSAPEHELRVQDSDGAPPELRANAPRGTYINISV